MPKNRNQKSRLAPLHLVACAAGSLLGGSAHAQVDVNANVAFDLGSGLYTYSYSVVNNGPLFDLAIINVPVAQNSSLMSLLAPLGFDISFDPGVGLVSFFEDADPGTTPAFAPSSTRGLFSFTSAVGPATVTFDALDAGGNTFTGLTRSPVPEPGTLMLLGAALLPAFSARRRRPSPAQPTHN